MSGWKYLTSDLGDSRYFGLLTVWIGRVNFFLGVLTVTSFRMRSSVSIGKERVKVHLFRLLKLD